MPTILAIDPSVNDIGWCIRDTNNEWEGGTISLPSEMSFHWRLKRIKDKLRFIQTVQYQAKLPINQIVYENPTFMGSAKGQIAAQKGYTINLGIVVGFCLGCFDISPHDIFGYTPMQWKGTVPKRATEAKFIRTFGQKVADRVSEHEIDATMMLYFHCEKMKYI